MISKIFGRWGIVYGLALGGLLLAGCHSEEHQFTELPGFGIQEGAQTGPPGTATKPLEVQFHIRPNDSLRVTFSDMPIPLTPMDVTVREDGKITLLQNHDFAAAGKTRAELQKDIHGFYVPNYYPSMTVGVDFQSNSRFYYVGGEVKTPGRQIYLSPIRLLGAIRSAGDFSDFAKRRAVELTRADGHKVTVNCTKAQKDPTLDPEVYPGDNIYVPRRGPIW
jgi:protein involved in polysaccharide export with SLBB domain